jgi:hypothetical protein
MNVFDCVLLAAWGLWRAGETVFNYEIEWDTVSTFTSTNRIARTSYVVSSDVSPVYDVQSISTYFSGEAGRGGTFTVTFYGQVVRVQWDVQAVDMKAALESLSTVDAVSVSRNRNAFGHTWLVTFTGMPYPGSLWNQLSVNGDGLLGPDAAVATGVVPETQTFSCTGPSSGSFQLSFLSVAVPVPGATTAAELVALLSGVESFGVSVTRVAVVIGGGQSTVCAPGGEDVHVTFIDLHGDQPLLVVGSASGGVTLGAVTETVKGVGQEVVGRLPYSKIVNVGAGGPYYFRVLPQNLVGYPRLVSWQTLLYTQQDLQSSLQLHQNRQYFVSSTVPFLPTSVAAAVASDTSVTLTWVPPVTNGGDPVTSYYVEYDTVNSFDSRCGGADEVQVLSLSALATTGRSIQVCFRGQCTPCEPLPILAGDLEDALEALSTIGDSAAVSVSRSGAGLVEDRYGYVYTITFHVGAGVPNIQGDLPPVTVVSCGGTTVSWSVHELVQGRGAGAGLCGVHSLAPSGALTIPGAPSVSYVVPDVVPGARYFFRLRAQNSRGVSPWQIATSAPWPLYAYDPPTSTFLAWSTERSNSSLDVSWLDVRNLKPEGSRGSPVESYRVQVDHDHRVEEVQVVNITVPSTLGAVTAGGFQYSLGGAALWECLPFDAPAWRWERALETLASVDDVTVEASLSVWAGATSYVVAITFVGPDVNGNVPELVRDSQCESWETASPGVLAATVAISTRTPGVTGGAPEVFLLATTSSGPSDVIDEASTIGLSIDFRGEVVGASARTACAGCATVAAGSNLVTTTADLRLYLAPGDRLSIDDLEYTVHTTLPMTSTSFYLSSYAQEAVGGGDILVSPTAMGTALVLNGDSSVTSAEPLCAAVGGDLGLSAGQLVKIGNTGGVYQVASCAGTAIALASAWTGASGFVTLYRRNVAQFTAGATAAEVQSALESVPGFGSVRVLRTGPDVANGYRWTITFLSRAVATAAGCASAPATSEPCVLVHNDRTPVLASSFGGVSAAGTVVRRGAFPNSIFTSGSSMLVAPRVSEVQRLRIGSTNAATLSGFFTLALYTPTAVTLRPNATALDVMIALNTLVTVGNVVVDRTPYTDGAVSGLQWHITFVDTEDNLPLLTLGAGTLTGAGVAAAVAQVVRGSPVPRNTTFTGLSPSEYYFVKVQAGNLDGLGDSTVDDQDEGAGVANFFPVRSSVPPPAPDITVTATANSELRVTWPQPVFNGDPIDKYHVEWTTALGTVPTLSVTITQSSAVQADITGYWALSHEEAVSPLLLPNATAADVAAALETFAGVRRAVVTLSAGACCTWSATFPDQIQLASPFTAVNNLWVPPPLVVPTIGLSQDLGTPPSPATSHYTNYGEYVLDATAGDGQADPAPCDATTDRAFTGVCSDGAFPVQTLKTEASAAISGTFFVSYKGATAELPFDASEREVQVALQGLGTGEVAVTRSALISNGYEWDITFRAPGAAAVESLVADSFYLVGEDASAEVYKRVLVSTTADRAGLTGSWRILLAGQVFGPFDVEVSAADVQESLAAGWGVGKLLVTRTSHVSGVGHVWRLLFVVVDGALDTFQALPNSDFEGVGATLRVHLPSGHPRNTFSIGNGAAVQTITFRTADGTSTGMTGTYRLAYDGVSAGTCVSVAASASDLAAYITDLVAAPRGFVTVVARSNIRYVRWVETHDRFEVPLLTLGSQVGCTPTAGEVLLNYELPAYPRATFNHHYVALRPSQTYFVRVTARNSRGYGHSSAWVQATTPTVGVAPSVPTSLTVGVAYTASSLSLVYGPPLQQGGLNPLTYRLEYDTSPTFSSANFKSFEVRMGCGGVCAPARALPVPLPACASPCLRLPEPPAGIACFCVLCLACCGTSSAAGGACERSAVGCDVLPGGRRGPGRDLYPHPQRPHDGPHGVQRPRGHHGPAAAVRGGRLGGRRQPGGGVPHRPRQRSPVAGDLQGGAGQRGHHDLQRRPADRQGPALVCAGGSGGCGRPHPRCLHVRGADGDHMGPRGHHRRRLHAGVRGLHGHHPLQCRRRAGAAGAGGPAEHPHRGCHFRGAGVPAGRPGVDHHIYPPEGRGRAGCR